MKISIGNGKSSLYIKLGAIMMVCLVLATSLVYGLMKKDIVISDAGKEITVSTFKDTVEDVFKEKDIKIGPYDKIDISMTEKLEDGMSISIQRAKKVNIKTKDSNTFIMTTAATVADALKEAKVAVDDKVKVEPAMNAGIKDGMLVSIVKVEEKLVSQKVQMDFTNEIKKNTNLAKGFVNVVRKGSPGEKQVSIKIVYEDGKEVSRQIVDEKVLKQPVNGLVEEGQKTTLVTSRGQQISFTRAVKMTATAYDASYESCGKYPDDPNYGITRSGLKVRPGIVAVDPRVIPLGTWLYVEGYGEALAADTGGAIKGNRIDLFYEDSRTVDRYGKKAVKVYILDKPRYRF